MIAAKIVFTVKHTMIHPLGDRPLEDMKKLFEEHKPAFIEELSKEFQTSGRELVSASAEVVEIVGT